MSSDSSSDGSSSSDDHRRKRKHKKHDKEVEKKRKKSKKAKRDKRHKEKKRSRRVEPKVQPTVPAPPRQLAEAVDNDDAFGPALPPHLLKQPQAAPMIGPVMPSNIGENTNVESVVTDHPNDEHDDDDECGTFGPLPNATQVELEERALALKLAALQGDSLNATATDQDVREEWMLELPEVGLKGGLAALNNMKRTFYQGKERPDFSDRSSWTKTPQSAAAAAGPKPCSSKDMEQAAQAKYERQRDEEQEQIAKKHKKKHKRDESLVELHQKKLRKEQREREKELAAAGAKPERRPFSRDVDLKLNKIDKNQTKSIVDKAKILNTKFSSGQAKYL
ncbi:GPALPP motifs-containing protein 1 isoform X3 [Drosophila sulfurigaster albostrigata]|uniref:GPALPP motifs-containing protein 1 isoform X3 n=1 Tax=Drosophila sulfurigaster albostrigata TaxID=89887 RepID=UPI002D21CB8B|nr:GPALPP motifs-containing protein 1 isoform X3 [Drosophila sulfurigaster albostrigata]XP_062122941.1 GPALPP motifs-containing protein 1 isoform X3 [Drosophila sulfurigaster albostrigata]